VYGSFETFSGPKIPFNKTQILSFSITPPLLCLALLSKGYPKTRFCITISILAGWILCAKPTNLAFT
jgi:hypothetical protein